MTDAVVLVGGQGLRLRPLTLDTPKPLLPMAGAPFLGHLLARLATAGIGHVVLATSYRADCFTPLCTDTVECVAEAEPRGTGGAVRGALPRLAGDSILVLNGDSLSGADLGRLIRSHVDTAAEATLALTEVPDPRAYGTVPTDRAGWVTGFVEKPAVPTTRQINAGCYVLRRSVIETIAPDRPVSLEHEVFPGLLRAGAPVAGRLDPAYWLDIGTPETYRRACRDLILGHAPSPIARRARDGVLALGSAVIEAGAAVGDGTTIGAGSRIAAGAQVSASVLMTGVGVGPGATLTRCVLADRVTVGPDAWLGDAVVGTGARIGAGARITGPARIWPGQTVPAGAALPAGTARD